MVVKTTNYYVFCLVSLVVIFCDAQSVDVAKLFHANSPSSVPNRPVNAQRLLQSQSQSIDSTNPEATELFDDEFMPYRASRHDEFDWAIIKVLK